MKSAIKEELETLLQEKDLKKITPRVNELIQSYDQLKARTQKPSESLETAAEGETEAASVPEEEHPEKEEQKLNQAIETLIADFKSKKKALKKSREQKEAENLAVAKDLLSELRNLIQNEENIGKAYAKIGAIHTKWKELGGVANEKYHDLQNEYSKLNEQFFYNIKIYKEIKEHDLKKNYSLKNQIVHKLDALLEEKHIKKVEKELKLLRNDWDEIGATYQDKWEEIKDRYWEKVRTLYDKISAHYEKEKEQRAENLEKKKALIEKIKPIATGEYNIHKAWSKSTEEIKSIQKEWKAAGEAPRKEERALWKEFRTLCDDYFERKSEFYAGRNEEFEQHKEKKEAIIKKANDLKDSEDWKKTTSDIINLQKDWKKIGNAGPKYENRLWKQFRKACDHFFTKKDEFFKQLDKNKEENLKAKKALIEKIKGYTPKKDEKEASLKKLEEFTNAFNEIGPLPGKEEKNILKEFNELMSKYYNDMGVQQEKKEKILLKAKVDTLKQHHNSDRLIQQEQQKIRKEMAKLKSEINQYENNMGFFGNSKGAEKLLEEVKGKIDKNKEKVNQLKEQLKILSNN